MTFLQNSEPFGCTVEATLSVIGGRWKPVILFRLMAGTRRFGELKKTISGITQRMLTNQLRELERDGVIKRQVYAEVPPKVEYSLTILGQSLEPILHAMKDWGTDYLKSKKDNKEMIDHES